MSASRRTNTLSRHLPCPICEYDLFGLAQRPVYLIGFVEKGRYVRCPECGEEVEVSSALRELRTRRVKAAFFLLGFCLGPFALLLFFGGAFLISGQTWQAILALVFVLPWLGGLWRYLHRRGHVDYAIRVLLMIHGCFLAAMAGGVAIVNGVLTLFPSPFRASGKGFVIAGALLLAVAWHLFWRAAELIEDGHDLHLRRKPAERITRADEPQGVNPGQQASTMSGDLQTGFVRARAGGSAGAVTGFHGGGHDVGKLIQTLRPGMGEHEV